MRKRDPLQTELENLNQTGVINISTRYTSAKLMVPQEVALEEIDGEMWIKYHFPVTDNGIAVRPQHVLAEFLKLAHEPISSNQFLRFARKWGVLCFCRHRFVASHSFQCFPFSDDPIYEEVQKEIEEAKDLVDAIKLKMHLVMHGVQFREPLSLWYQYASQMAALIKIYLYLKGDWDGDMLTEWNIIRQVGLFDEKGRAVFPVLEYEKEIGIPIHQQPLEQKSYVLRNVISKWIAESYFIPHIEWRNLDKPNRLFAQNLMSASYAEVGLFASEQPTLYSVLVTQCISVLGPDSSFRRCSCSGCKVHSGGCQELIESAFSQPGRPKSYCDRCKHHVHQLQKSASRKRRRQESEDKDTE